MPVLTLRMTFSHVSAWTDIADIERVEDQPAGLQSLIVTGDAVLIDERALRIVGCRRWRLHRPRADSASGRLRVTTHERDCDEPEDNGRDHSFH